MTPLASPTAPLPWQENVWQQFNHLLAIDRLPQALILYGRTGLGKQALALAMAARLLCLQVKENKGCGTCVRCRLCLEKQHPDLIELVPESIGSGIKIDAVRELRSVLMEKGFFPGYRVIVINPACSLNTAAANALLKTLEEPGDRVLFILNVVNLRKVPATILSRCQILRLSLPSAAMAEAWIADPDARDLLAVAHGAPGHIETARARLSSMRELGHILPAFWQQQLRLSDALIKIKCSPAELLWFLYEWTLAIIRYKLAQAPMASWLSAFFDMQTIQVKTSDLFLFLDELHILQAPIQPGGVALNPELTRAELLMKWQALHECS